jgi:hypothetical protein
MDERADAAGSRTGESDIDRSPRASSTPDLLLTVVQYETRPDRGTVHPPGLTGIDRMETWLSADAAAFVDLDTWR